MKKATTINVSMSPEFADMLDRWTAYAKRSRSDFVREAVRHYIIKLKENNHEENSPLS